MAYTTICSNVGLFNLGLFNKIEKYSDDFEFFVTSCLTFRV